MSDIGHVVRKWWLHIPTHFSNVALDNFIVMPNHLHGIIQVGAGSPRPSNPSNTQRADAEEIAKQEIAKQEIAKQEIAKQEIAKQGAETAPLRPTLGQILGFFKYQSTKEINLLRNTSGVPFWQRNYYEHVIRDREDLDRVREYIRANPWKWPEDEENPNRTRNNAHP